jgi:uncharacterized HAD superfamily protein
MKKKNLPGKKLKIGIDIDNVISDTFSSYIEKFNNQFGTKITYEEMSDFYYFEKYSGIEKEKVAIFIEEITRDYQYHLSLSPYKEAGEVIKKWLKVASLHYITLRPTYMKKVTVAWLKKHGFWSKNATLHLYEENKNYTSDADYKKKISEKIGIDFLIEDAWEIAVEFKIPVFLIDRPWNKTAKLPGNVKRVGGWQEIENLVFEKFGI